MPPLPPASTTGSSPEGAGRAESLESARCAASSASSSTDTSSKRSKPTVRAAVSYPVCRPVSPTATHDTAKRVRAWRSLTSRPSELATRISRRDPPQPTCTWEIASPEPRAASSARRSSSRVSAFDPSGVRGPRSPCEPSASRSGPTATVWLPAPLLATADAAFAARSRPASVRSEVWAYPVVSPETTLIPAPRSRPDESSSTLPSSRLAPEDDRSSAKTSANSPPRRSASDSTCSSTGVSITGGLLASRHPLAGFSLRHVWYRRASADRSLRPHRADGHRGRHRRIAANGNGAGARHAAAHRAVRRGELRGDRRTPLRELHLRREAPAIRPSGTGRDRGEGLGRGHARPD